MPHSHIPVKHCYSSTVVESLRPKGHKRPMENVRKIRELRGLTQAELGELVGKNQGYISKLEAGRMNPTVSALTDLARALAVQPSELFTLPELHRRALVSLDSMDRERQEAALVVLEAMAKGV